MQQATDVDDEILERLRARDEAAFMVLVERYNGTLLRMARMYVHDRAVAEEVVQDTWMGVLRGLGGFEGRSALKTWIFRILMNSARTRAVREQRTIPFSAVWDATDDAEPAVEPERFRPPGAQWAGGWKSFPESWGEAPEERLLSRETRSHVLAALDRLPPSQREVVTLRDVEGWSSGEVCNALAISESNQRVLLHRGRSRVRRELERYFTGR